MMVYGELGTVTYINIKSRMLTYLARLCLEDKNNKISNTIYSLLYT